MNSRLFLILSCMSLLIGCEINIFTEDYEDGTPAIDSQPAEALFQREDLYGTWEITGAKFAEDATMTEWEYEYTYATFTENGLYEGDGYWGEGGGTYSISGNTITVLMANTPYITYEVLSLTGTEAEIKATIVSTAQNIWIHCEKEEVVEPETSISSDFFGTFENTKACVAMAYAYLRDYMLYHHYIEYNALNNNRRELTPESEIISKAWGNGYKAIQLTNIAVKALASTDFDWQKECIRHFRTIRAFTYYNMVTLWGDVLYWTENDDPMNVARFPRTKAEEVINAEIASLSDTAFDRKIMDFGNSTFCMESAKLLLAEMYLYTNDRQKAQTLLSEIDEAAISSDEIFAISLDQYTPIEDNYFEYYKDLICPETDSSLDIYTTEFLELYTIEAEPNYDIMALPDLWRNNTAQYGYWPMLNRIGQATGITGCVDYETLMPLPGMELRSNPNINQNPGY